MGPESHKRIIKLPLESAATQISNTRYDLSPLIAYAKRHNKRLQDLTTEELAFLHYEENIEHLPLWEVHYIQGQQCRMIIRIDESNVLNAAIEHDDVANAPSFTVVESDGEWQLAIAHTYLAGVCYAFNVDLADIKKPTRINARNQRSRGVKPSDVRGDTQRDISPRLYDFANVVGCRRAEYAALRQNDLVTDVNGHLCVLIRRGKGGKKQYQRILPGDIELVKSYFDGSDTFVFSKDEIKNKLDLHALRAQQARKAYAYYLGRLQNEPEYRAILLEEIKRTWGADDAERVEKGWQKKRWRQSQVEGEYRLRGETRKLAVAHDLPVCYDRLAAMAVSIYHLAHWRLDVTIDNYLIAV